MKYSVLFFAALVVTGTWGCGSRDTRYRAPTIPVKGTLLVDGKPFGPCVIFFSAIEQDRDPKKWVPTVTGLVKEDGSFELTTYDQGDGAPAGKYDVSLGAEASNLLAKVPECRPVDIEIEDSDVAIDKLEVKLVSIGGTQAGP